MINADALNRVYSNFLKLKFNWQCQITIIEDAELEGIRKLVNKKNCFMRHSYNRFNVILEEI